MAGGELGPQDIPKLLECLQNALNPRGEVQKAAEASLESLEQTPGFCACLAVRLVPTTRANSWIGRSLEYYMSVRMSIAITLGQCMSVRVSILV
jgi:hypothetical protein